MSLPSLPWPEGLKDNIQLVSFDIFDTLIFRHAGTPDDFFFHLACEATQKGLWLQDDNQGFVKLRRKAEDIARRARFAKSGHREVTLAEIYSHWPAVEGVKLCVHFIGLTRCFLRAKELLLYQICTLIRN
jgi:hypothetical protein